MKRLAVIAACLLVLAGCKHKEATPSAERHGDVDYAAVAIPSFCGDSAYAYAAAQLAFGHRIPGSAGWESCSQWIAAQMQRWCDTVVVQHFNATLWDGRSVPGRNIIASLNPGANRRIVLAAHWDSRSWADHDPDASRHRRPVPGANDGASGTAVLMEMARVMSSMPPSVGVDFVFFDVEDQGAPEWAEERDADTWCKGSQYWSRTPHRPFYSATYGILFDMVGTLQPRFTKEGIGQYYAPGLMDKLWGAAAQLGYGTVFVNQESDEILDDHYYVNRLAGIPMVDIVQNSGTTSFFEHWHTVTDDLQSLSGESLQLVATVVLKTLYGDYPHATL